jgi:hypothetical protein
VSHETHNQISVTELYDLALILELSYLQINNLSCNSNYQLGAYVHLNGHEFVLLLVEHNLLRKLYLARLDGVKAHLCQKFKNG